MIDIRIIHKSFPEFEEIELLKEPSGQKYVFRARKSRDTVILKLLKRTHLSSEDEERFEREVESLSKLRKLSLDFIPKVYDYGEKLIGGQKISYIIEQCIDGCTYREKLLIEPVQPLTEVIRFAGILLYACVAFEKASLVHRDIKPENIMIDKGKKIWIIDFGLVRCLDMPSLTHTSAFIGSFTPGYAPPEQMRNRKRDIDARTDLFSVGIVLYESLCGSNPHCDGISNVLEIVKSVESKDLPPLKISQDIDGELSLFISSLTSRYLSRRPQTAQEALLWFTEICNRFKLNKQ